MDTWYIFIVLRSEILKIFPSTKILIYFRSKFACLSYFRTSNGIQWEQPILHQHCWQRYSSTIMYQLTGRLSMECHTIKTRNSKAICFCNINTRSLNRLQLKEIEDLKGCVKSYIMLRSVDIKDFAHWFTMVSNHVRCKVRLRN